MPALPGMKELQARKRDLLLTSALNRETLRLELEALRMRGTEFERGFRWSQGAWRWVVSLAGFLLARRWRKQGRGGWMARLSVVWTAFNALAKAWRAARGR